MFKQKVITCRECGNPMTDFNILSKKDLYRKIIKFPYTKKQNGYVFICKNPRCTHYDEIKIKGFDF